VVTSSSSTGAQPVTPSSIAVSVDLPHARVRVAGELDRDSAHHLLEAVEILATRPGRQWQLDAADVTFCDASGLRALTSAHAFAASHGRSLRLVRRSRPVARLVSLLGEDEVFPPAPTPGPHSARVLCGTTRAT
jgi:anti-sigma B factor antagonist